MLLVLWPPYGEGMAGLMLLLCVTVAAVVGGGVACKCIDLLLREWCCQSKIFTATMPSVLVPKVRQYRGFV